MIRVRPGPGLVTNAIVELRRRETDEHLPRKEDEVYVVDLVRCPLKRRFEMLYPQLVYATLLEPRLIIGDVIHRGLEAMLKEFFGSDAMVESEGIETGRAVDLGDRVVEVRGRIDAVVTIDGRRYGVEIKYTANGQNAPYQHHVEQAAVYNWLYGLDATLLVYLSPDGVREYIVEDSVTDEWVEARVREVLSGSPAPRYDWECRYCPFRTVCARRKT